MSDDGCVWANINFSMSWIKIFSHTPRNLVRA